MHKEMTPEQETVLSLIRAIVRGAHDVRLKVAVCWAKVMSDVTRQGMQGRCFDALDLLDMLSEEATYDTEN